MMCLAQRKWLISDCGAFWPPPNAAAPVFGRRPVLAAAPVFCSPREAADGMWMVKAKHARFLWWMDGEAAAAPECSAAAPNAAPNAAADGWDGWMGWCGWCGWCGFGCGWVKAKHARFLWCVDGVDVVDVVDGSDGEAARFAKAREKKNCARRVDL